MDIQWFSKNNQGIATIYESNITLNTTASSYFKNTYAVLIGFDKSNNTLLIKSLNKEEATLSNYRDYGLHEISIKPSYGRITGKQIIKNICSHYPLNFQKKNMYKFQCEWDASQNYLKVFLESEVK